SSENVDLMLSSGGSNRAAAPADSLIRRFRAALPSQSPDYTYASCNDPLDDEVEMLYCEGAAEDTQGRLLHGDTAAPFSSTGPACTANNTGGDAYIAWEMRSAARG